MADPHSVPAGPDRRATKTALRRRVLATRNDLTPQRRAADARAIAGHAVAWAPLAALRPGDVVTAYVSVGSEPGTRPLLAALLERGLRVLVPVVLADRDLDWAAYVGEEGLARAAHGLLEPAGERLGREAVRTADVVLAPGVAASPTGDRLGHGGGCYDRALARVRSDTPIAVVLGAEEVGLPVPVEPHDRPVSHALTPAGVVSFSPAPDPGTAPG